MPGTKDYSKPGAVYVPPWAIYRDDVSANDNLVAPEAVTQLIDLSALPSGAGCQIWVVAQRLSGTGTCKLTAFGNGFGSLATLKPYNQGSTLGPVDHLGEVRFTGLIAVPHRLLVTEMSAGAHWTFHVTFTSLPA